MGTFMLVAVVSMAVVIGVVSTLVTYFALRRLGRFRNALSLDELDALYDDHDDDVASDDKSAAADVSLVMLRAGTLRCDAPQNTISNPTVNSRYSAVNHAYQDES